MRILGIFAFAGIAFGAQARPNFVISGWGFDEAVNNGAMV